MNYVLTNNALTCLINNKIYTVNSNNPHWIQIINAIREDDETALLNFIDIRPTLQHKGFVIENDMVYHNGKPIHNAITQRIVRAIQEELDPKPMLSFLGNLYQNPSARAIEMLYTFLESNNLPITPDGCFIAYKRINENWTDCHSGTMTITLGTPVSMPRNEVDDDPNRTCSTGLHVCSLPYLAHFCGARLIVCKVNPRDVVCIPYDYENTKIRTCEYLPMSEIDMRTVEEFDAAHKAIYVENRPMDDDEPDEDEIETDENEYDEDEDEDENNTTAPEDDYHNVTELDYEYDSIGDSHTPTCYM